MMLHKGLLSLILVLIITQTESGGVENDIIEEENHLLRRNSEEARQLQETSGNFFFGVSTYCHREATGRYITRSIWRLFAAYHRSHGDVPGVCQDHCTSLCEHQACINDFAVTSDGLECQCLDEGGSTCGPNTLCNDNDVCQCLPGYSGDPDSLEGCFDDDECVILGSSACGANAVCINKPGTYTCECGLGFSGNDPKNEGCQDINECDSIICGSNGNCTNTKGFYSCECDEGYSWLASYGRGCEDIDECALRLDECGKFSTCENTIGSYRCSCEPGYAAVPPGPPEAPCEDIDECETDAALECESPIEVCKNTQGSFECVCAPGFRYSFAQAKCIDVDECLDKPCNKDTEDCKNTFGSYECTCRNGYQLDPAGGGACIDVDECTIEGGFECEPVIEKCSNLVGSHECVCADGYERDKTSGLCVDIDECEELQNACSPNEDCFNTIGSYDCECADGYERTEESGETCVDIDECLMTQGTICGDNSSCNNIPGKYTCSCNKGYEGDPPNCVPDVCTSAGLVCGDNSFCDTAVPVCRCDAGYQGNTTEGCTDTNECELRDACATDEKCVNLEGSYYCQVPTWSVCPSQDAQDCIDDFCAMTSSTDSTYRCCESVYSCNGGTCCVGAYTNQEPCGGNNSDQDCEGSLECVWRSPTNRNFICCSNPLPLPVINQDVCSYLL